MEVNIEQFKDDLRRRVEQCRIVVEGLGDNEAFQLLLNDYEKQKKMLDDAWQNIDSEEKMQQAQITKMAVMSVLNSIENYKTDMKNAQIELAKLENPDEFVNKDYDSK